MVLLHCLPRLPKLKLDFPDGNGKPANLLRRAVRSSSLNCLLEFGGAAHTHAAYAAAAAVVAVVAYDQTLSQDLHYMASCQLIASVMSQ